MMDFEEGIFHGFGHGWGWLLILLLIVLGFVAILQILTKTGK